MPSNAAFASDDVVLARTRAWLSEIVIGLELCPFAKQVYVKEQIRYCVSRAQTPEELLQDLLHELHALSLTDPTRVDTTLLIHPHALAEFSAYNEFLSVAVQAGEVQRLSADRHRGGGKQSACQSKCNPHT